MVYSLPFLCLLVVPVSGFASDASGESDCAAELSGLEALANARLENLDPGFTSAVDQVLSSLFERELVVWIRFQGKVTAKDVSELLQLPEESLHVEVQKAAFPLEAEGKKDATHVKTRLSYAQALKITKAPGVISIRGLSTESVFEVKVVLTRDDPHLFKEYISEYLTKDGILKAERRARRIAISATVEALEREFGITISLERDGRVTYEGAPDLPPYAHPQGFGFYPREPFHGIGPHDPGRNATLASGGGI